MISTVLSKSIFHFHKTTKVLVLQVLLSFQFFLFSSWVLPKRSEKEKKLADGRKWEEDPNAQSK